jgi:hypothetical protein
VLLLSPGILTRPWCLLEIREAMSMGKAIVLVQLTGPGKHFSFEETFEMLSDIEHNMPALNPSVVHWRASRCAAMCSNLQAALPR